VYTSEKLEQVAENQERTAETSRFDGKFCYDNIKHHQSTIMRVSQWRVQK